MKKRMLLTLIVSFVCLLSCKKEYSQENHGKKDYNLVLQFKAMVDTVPLVFGQQYRNFYDEPYQVSAFKFYISHIALINTDSNIVYNLKVDNDYLVDFSDSVSTRLLLKAVPYTYNRIAFTIGVDSIKNVSGAQGGALDPAKGMFWTWNSGYIMAKLEGSSPVSSQPNNKIEYHIGGFKGPDNVIRRLTLLYPFSSNLTVQEGKIPEMLISANSNAWFSNPHEIKISDNPVCMTPGAMAKDIAENYSKMFTVVEIKN